MTARNHLTGGAIITLSLEKALSASPTLTVGPIRIDPNRVG